VVIGIFLTLEILCAFAGEKIPMLHAMSIAGKSCWVFTFLRV